MDKNKKTYIVIGLIILILILLPYIQKLQLFATYPNTEESLKYQVHNSGTCDIYVLDDNNLDHIYTINVSVSANGNNIYARFDGRPQLPPAFAKREFGSGGNQCTRFGLSYYDWNNMWKLIEKGMVEGIVDTCKTGASDKTPYDGVINYQCNEFCVPDKAVCISDSILAKCSSDGKVINHVTCDNGCENYACKIPENHLSASTDKETYSLNENIIVNGSFMSPSGSPIVGVKILVDMIRNGGVVNELNGTTDTNGNIKVTFLKPTIVGETTIQLIVSNYMQRSYESEPITIEIPGESVSYELTTYSYTQYSSKNITFNVVMKDSKGAEILPTQLNNLQTVLYLTQGKIYTQDITYKGAGLYEVNSLVDGSGEFVGKITFNFEGLPQSSPIIKIEVRPMSISIDTSKISPSASIDETKNYTISLFDATGLKLDPENIYIKVSLPDGTTIKNMPFTEITRIGEGVYQFSYTFTQVEKHTFDIYAQYSNYAEGYARASVAVNGNGEIVGPGPWWIIYTPYIISAGIIFIVLYIVAYKKIKNTRQFKNWLWHNKEGAIIGGIVGVIISFSAMNFPFIMDYMNYLTSIFNNAIWSVWVINIGLGVIIGAIIDSLYKPNK